MAAGAYTDAKPLRFKGTFDPFKVLGLPKEQALPAAAVLKKAFKKGALKWHPDRCKRSTPIEECEARMEEVHLAQDVLSDERKLQQWEAWDEDRRGGPGPGGRPGGGRQKPFAEPRTSGSGFSGFGGGRDPFSGGFDFGGRSGTGGRRAPRPRPSPSPAPRPRPRTQPKAGHSTTCLNEHSGKSLEPSTLKEASVVRAWYGRQGAEWEHGKGKGSDVTAKVKQLLREGKKIEPSVTLFPDAAPGRAKALCVEAQEEKQWRVVSRQKNEGTAGAEVEVITRERDLVGTPMVQVEVVEKTCYKAQVQCQEEVLERRRRRRDEASGSASGSASNSEL